MIRLSNYMKNCYKNKQKASFRDLNIDTAKQSSRLLRKVCSGFTYIGARCEILTLFELLSLYLWSPRAVRLHYLSGWLCARHRNSFSPNSFRYQNRLLKSGILIFTKNRNAFVKMVKKSKKPPGFPGGLRLVEERRLSVTWPAPRPPDAIFYARPCCGA